MTDGIKWGAYAKVIKYDPETVREIAKILGHEPTGPELRRLEEREGLTPDATTEAFGNLLTTNGLIRVVSLIIGAGGQALSTTRAMAGVGNSSTAATVADTDLNAAAGSTNRWFQAMDSSNPSVTGTNGVITGNTTFQSADGNFTWNEWCWAIATAAPVASAVFATATTSGTMLNHKVQSLGTKVSGAVWTLQATITLS